VKRLISLAIALILVLSFAACGEKPAADVDIGALASELGSSGVFVDTLAEVPEKTVSTLIGIDVSTLESYQYRIGSGSTGEEFGVFKCKSEDAAKAVVAKLEKRVADQTKSYENYVAEAVERLDNAIIVRSGVYVAIVVANDYAAAGKIVDGYFG